MKYLVIVKEVHLQKVEVEAKSVDKAIEAVREGEGNFLDGLEYQETLDPDTWEVEEL